MFFIQTCFASEESIFNPSPVLEKEKTCCNKTTADSEKCLDDVYKLLDKELNKIYNDLLKITTDKKVKDLLINSQREWINFRDKEFAFYSKYYDIPGTIWGPVCIKMKVAFIKSRIKTLYKVYKSLDMSSSGKEEFVFD